MATKPVAWQEQDPISSPDEWVTEFWAQGEVGATMSRDEKAPRAEPEEDLDARDEALQQNQTFQRPETPDATEATRISPHTPKKTQDMVTELGQISQISGEGSVDPCLGDFPPPPPPPSHLSASSTEECFENESSSSLEGEVAEWVNDAEIMSDPTEDHMSPDGQKRKEGPPLLREVGSSSEELTADNLTAEEKDIQLDILPDNHSEPEGKMLRAAHHSPSCQDDLYAVHSPPFADESEEEEEVSADVTSCQHHWTTGGIRDESSQPSHSTNTSVSTEHDPASHRPAVPSAKQQEKLLPLSQSDLSPKGAIQEAAQQVLGQSSSPLSVVAMELSNQGGAAASQGSVAERVRHSREGERTEAESRQTGGEGGQKESGLQRNKVVPLQHDGGLLTFPKTVQTKEVQPGKLSFMTSKHSRMESDSCDDSQSDSGVSADFSPCSTLEGNATTCPAALPKETPIEREIRRAIEREHSLRRSRGLPNLPASPEYVEIPLRRTVLCQSITAKSERCQDKDRQFAGKKMQHEIHQESRREQDLVKLGKVPGFYDKGTVRQVKERKQLFEAFQKPSDSTLNTSARSNTLSKSSTSNTSTLENQEDISSQASTIGGSYVERIPTNSAKEGSSTCSTPRGPDFSDRTSRQVIIIESIPAQRLNHTKPQAVDSGSPKVSSSRTGGHGGIKVREKQKEEEEEEVPTENPFFKLRSSTNLVKVEQDIREAQEREKEFHLQRVSLYGGTREERPVSTKQRSPVLSSSSSSSQNGLTVPDSSSRGGTQPTSAEHQSVGKFAAWPLAQSEEQEVTRPVTLQSPQTPRQKSPLVQRWESGLVNGHSKEGD